jgi:hypothetical protein
MPADELRRRYTGVLLDRLRETRYPSPTMLDRAEAAITDRETAEEYVGALIELLEQDKFPSPPMVDRVHRLLAVL